MPDVNDILATLKPSIYQRMLHIDEEQAGASKDSLLKKIQALSNIKPVIPSTVISSPAMTADKAASNLGVVGDVQSPMALNMDGNKLAEFFGNPTIPAEHKKALYDKLLGGSVVPGQAASTELPGQGTLLKYGNGQGAFVPKAQQGTVQTEGTTVQTQYKPNVEGGAPIVNKLTTPKTNDSSEGPLSASAADTVSGDISDMAQAAAKKRTEISSINNAQENENKLINDELAKSANEATVARSVTPMLNDVSTLLKRTKGPIGPQSTAIRELGNTYNQVAKTLGVSPINQDGLSEADFYATASRNIAAKLAQAGMAGIDPDKFNSKEGLLKLIDMYKDYADKAPKIAEEQARVNLLNTKKAGSITSKDLYDIRTQLTGGGYTKEQGNLRETPLRKAKILSVE